MKKNSPKIIISGGGTGGHVFPAIAIANAIREIAPDSDILFVGAEGKIEMQKVPAAGYKIIGLPVAGFQRKLSLKNFVVIFKLVKSLLKAKKIIKDFNPQLAIGVGGYASGPVLKSAERRGITTLLQEQNSYAGVTNKLLAKKASIICVAYSGLGKYFPEDKIILTGNPVRKNIIDNKTTALQGKERFGFSVDDKVVLVLGGSLGARTLNESILKNLDNISDSNVKYIWQSGPYYYKAMHEKLEESGARNVQLFDFISEMDMVYAAADVIISRAGAGTISELCLLGKPVILVPSPNVAEDHQTKNAKALEDKGAALLIKDSDAREILYEKTISLIDDLDRRNSMSEAILKLAIPDSAERIAREALKLITN